MSNVAQRLVTRLGPRRVLAFGLLLSATAEGLLVRLPVHGHYATDLLPSFLLLGAGMGISFVSVTIAALAGVPGRDAGIASGLVNTARQVGGAVGLAGVTTLATIYAGHRSVHESLAAGATHGLPGRVRDARRALRRRRNSHATMRVRHPGERDRRTGGRLARGGSMTTMERIDGGAILDHTIDDLLLQARGLVLVREVLAGRGASQAELDAHTQELERVRRRLAKAIARA